MTATHWSAARAWQTNAVLLTIGAAMLLLAKQLIRENDRFTIGFSGVSGWSVVLYVVAAGLILTQPTDRWTFPIIVTVAVTCRLATLFPAPFLSSDVYRYVWDGVVQHAHISPYRYVPGDAALTFLREPNREIFDHINRRDYARTIYPPAAQMLFYLISFISPTVTFMKTALVLFEGVTMYGLVALLRELGLRREQTLLYAWCPLLIWEIAGSGHLDSAAMAFIVLALLARYRKLPLATGTFLAVAVLIKLYPIVLFPALYRRGDYKMPAVMVAMIAFGYACYASVGKLVFGFLGGYVKEEGMDTGARFFLLEQAQHLPGLHALPEGTFLVLCVLVFAALILWCWNTCCRAESPPTSFLASALALAFALMILFSPHYPWYIAWLIPMVVLLPTLTVFTYICGLFYLCTTALAVGSGAPQFRLNQILYGSVLIAFLVEVALRNWPIHRPIFTLSKKRPA